MWPCHVAVCSGLVGKRFEPTSRVDPRATWHLPKDSLPLSVGPPNAAIQRWLWCCSV